MALILQTGYEDAVRSKLGVKQSELPNTEINQRMILELAESVIAKKVPNHASITDTVERLFLENSVIAYVCHLLSPGMARRLNQKVATLDVRWEKAKVDWDERALEFLSESETSLMQITTVEVDTVGDSSIVGIIRRPYNPIGGA